MRFGNILLSFVGGFSLFYCLVNYTVTIFYVWVNSEMSPNVMIDYWLLHTFKGTLYCTRRSMSLHLRGQQLRRSIGRKESFHQVLQRFNSHRIGLGTPTWAPFCLGTPKHNGRDVMWKNSIYIIEKVAKDLLTLCTTFDSVLYDFRSLSFRF